jgi:hypothetical protein
MIILCQLLQGIIQLLMIKIQQWAKQKTLSNHSSNKSKKTIPYLKYLILDNSFQAQFLVKPFKITSSCVWGVHLSKIFPTFFLLPLKINNKNFLNMSILNGYISGLKLYTNSIFLIETFGMSFQLNSNDLYILNLI